MPRKIFWISAAFRQRRHCRVASRAPIRGLRLSRHGIERPNSATIAIQKRLWLRRRRRLIDHISKYQTSVVRRDDLFPLALCNEGEWSNITTCTCCGHVADGTVATTQGEPTRANCASVCALCANSCITHRIIS